MRRLLALLLLTLLPLQFSWAAVAPYCGHEEAPHMQHVGHHTHEHDTKAPVALDTEATLAADVGPALVDLDCAQCHGGCAVAPSVGDGQRADRRSGHPAAMPAWTATGPQQSRPERPQWLGLA